MIDSVLIDKCIARFAQEPVVRAVWILGSAVSNRMRKDSDVDFAVYYEPGRELDLNAHGALLLDLESILGRAVDLGRLSSRNLIYAVQATHEGQLIFARDPLEPVAFTGRIQSLYVDLKHDRKTVEDAYCA